MKKLLVISFTFPPIEGIGGRRWAKFSKYLLRENIDVQILTAKLPSTIPSEWTDDINRLQIENRIHFFDTHYPEVLVKPPQSILDKLLYRLALYRVKSKIKGSFYDKSALCKGPFLAAVTSFIEKGFKNIILSVGPFYFASFLPELKKKFPNINIILDVRDPWTNNKTSFGYSTLHKERFEVEKIAEKKVALGYDFIVSVADDIGQYFINEYKISPDKVLTVKNGFDTEDIPPAIHLGNSKKHIVFTGNLYEKANPSFQMFYHQLRDLKSQRPDLFRDFEFHFYGEIHPSMQHYFTEDLNLFFHQKISLKSVYEKISNASACLLFLTDDLNYSFSTKFYEYLSLKKPILVFSKPGKTGLFVEENGIGRQMDGNNLSEVIESLDDNKFYRQSIDISAYDVENLTKQYLTLIH